MDDSFEDLVPESHTRLWEHFNALALQALRAKVVRMVKQVEQAIPTNQTTPLTWNHLEDEEGWHVDGRAEVIVPAGLYMCTATVEFEPMPGAKGERSTWFWTPDGPAGDTSTPPNPASTTRVTIASHVRMSAEGPISVYAYHTQGESVKILKHRSAFQVSRMGD